MEFALYNLKDNHKLFKELIKYQRNNNVDIDIMYIKLMKQII